MEKMMSADELKQYRSIQKLLKAEIDYKGKKTTQFDTKSYYYANWKDKSKNMLLQKGLANFSFQRLGDDRLWYDQSFYQDSFNPRISSKKDDARLTAEQILANRERDYAYALSRYSDDDIEAVEAAMREKLKIRSKATGGIYQLRRTFKYFDQESTGGIGLNEIGHAFSLMGFAINETQILALFAKYDRERVGRIPYTELIQVLSEKDFEDVKPTWLRSKEELEKLNMKRRLVQESMKKTQPKITGPSDYDASEYDEAVSMEKHEVKKIYENVDKTGEGLDEHHLTLLLIILGTGFQKTKIEDLVKKIIPQGAGSPPKVSFEDFWACWVRLTSSITKPATSTAVAHAH